MKAREFANTKLVVFDIDDTLVNTDTRVNVVRDGEVIKQLNSHDFTHYRLQPGEEFDFGRFRDAREFYTNARPIAPMIDRLRRDIATGNKVIMLTARADFNDRDVFLDTFRKYGIDMDRVHVYRAGNLQTRASTEEKKKIILQHLLGKQHYDKVIMYDDSVPNLNAFLTLSRDFPWSRFYAWHVDPNGRATEYHRSGLREDSESENLPSVARAQQAIPQILARAQRDYDAWDEEDRDTYAGGGICHIIADSVCDVLSDAGIECTSVSCSYEQHVYVAARFAEGVYTIDIPYHVYEEGGGFSWKKLPDVRFEPRDVVFYRVSGDPADWRDYLDEGLRDIVNYIRNIGSEQDAPIVMMTNPQNTGARTASGQRMRIEDFPLRTVAVSELRPWEPMIKMRDLPSQRTVASLMQTLRQGGRIPPLLVTPVRGGYRIIDGHHRYAALQRAGIEQAPVRVVDPRLIRYSDEIMEALKITLERYGHLAVKEQAGEERSGGMIIRWQQVTPNKIMVQARSGDGSEELGSVKFYRYDPGSKKWTGEALHVAERYRRQGVATAMYDWFRQKFGPIRPSDAQTRDGKSFWQGKRVWEQGVAEGSIPVYKSPSQFYAGGKKIYQLFRSAFPNLPEHVANDIYNQTSPGTNETIINALNQGQDPKRVFLDYYTGVTFNFQQDPGTNLTPEQLKKVLLNGKWKQQILSVNPADFSQHSRNRMIKRNFGINPDEDPIRMQRQQSKAKGDGSNEPVIIIQTSSGLVLWEGFHRTMSILSTGKNGNDPLKWNKVKLRSWVVSFEQQDVAESLDQSREIQLGPQLFVSRQTTTEDIKPRGVAWTSTAQKTPQGFTSDWIEWCKDNMAQWVTDTGILYDVAPGARILLLRTDRDVIQVARQYGLEIKNSFDLFEKMDWDVLRQDYDAVHHIPQGRDPFMSAWDVESTAWFDRKFLTNPRRVTVDTGKTHDIVETDKPGVAESLDQPYRIKWERSAFGDLDAIATLEDGTNLLIMFNNEVYQWRVEFYRGDRQDITGEGDAQRIFATVLKAIREFIRRKKPLSIVFGSVKEIDPRGSRTRLYDRMVQRYANDLGYTLQRQQDSSHTVYRLDRQQDVAEGLVNETQTVTRIDSKPITDFASELRAYKHTDDWSQSGIDTGDDSYWRKNNLQVKTTKGLFAGDPKRTALYATGNAHETRYVEFTRNGKSYVYFAAEDVPRFKNRKTYLSVFDAKNFRKLPTGEYFSENPGAPIKQIEITDPFAYIQKQGWNVRITRDLDKVFQQVKDMHQRGKIPYYGGEGMSESQQGVAEGQLDEIYKMPPTKNSSQGMTVWAYNDAIEKKSPVVYRGNDVIIFAANENLLRYIRLQDGKPVLYIGFTRFLDGYKSGTVATEMSGRGKGLAKQAYLDASDILKAPIYSDSTQTDASRLGIWDKLIQQYPDRVVGFDQKNNQNLPLSMTDRGPVVNQNQPIYVDRDKKDSAKPVAPNQRYRTRILKLLPVRQGMAEGIDPDTYEELDARIIARAAKQIVPTARARRTPDGYVHVTTEDGLDLYIGAGVADGSISVNIGSGGGVTTSGAHKGAVTDIIRGVYLAAVRKYGEPDTPGELTIDHDAGHGVWQHIADKLGLRYAAVEVKESDVRRGQLGETRDQLWSWIQAKFPSPQWPEYVQRDFLYAKAKGIQNQKDSKDFLDEIQRDFGRVKWRLQKLPITLNIFTPKTQGMIKQREGGSKNPYQVPKDAERHALQQQMIQQKGVSPEPIIVAKLSNGYDLIEGWHRTIQHLKAYPQGYTGPAWVGYGATYTSESKQGVAEGRISDLDIDLQDQQWEAVVGRVEHGVRRGEDPDGMSLALYQWATDEMFDMDEELERRGFDSVGDLADHIRDHGGRYVPPKFDLSAAGSIKDIERLPRRRPDDVAENFADGKKPGRKGLSKRVGIPRKATLGQLEKIAKSSTGERRRMAQWQLNMRRGQKKNK